MRQNDRNSGIESLDNTNLREHDATNTNSAPDNPINDYRLKLSKIIYLKRFNIFDYHLSISFDYHQ